VTAPSARRRRGGGLLAGFGILVYLFLYAPILVLVVFSFNRGRLTAAWEGFTLAWYAKLFADPQILSSLRNSLVVAFTATAVCTVIGTAAALAFFRHRFRRQAALDALITVPIVVPEIVLASSLVLLFAAIGLRLGFLTVILAHVAFSVSYAVVVVKARFAGFDRSLEEASMDLGAGPAATFFKVTLPGIFPGVMAAALLVFALSIDDYVITSFVAGVGTTTLPIQIYSMVRTGITPEINAVSTLLLVATSLMLFAAHRLQQGRSGRSAALPIALALGLLTTPFVFGKGVSSGEKVLNLYIWSNYISPETIRKFEKRQGVHVNVDLYDTNEAMLAKVQTGNVSYDLLCPSNYPIESLRHQNLLRPLDHSALPHLANVDPRFLDKPYDPGNRYSVPYFWGTCGIAFDKKRVGPVDSWAALWDPRYKGRILMLDDPRETLGATLKWKGHSVNTTDPAVLAEAQRLLLEQKPLVKTYNASNFEDVLLSRDVWIAQGWNGQFAKVMDVDHDLDYVIPKEGASFFVDSLVIPLSAPHPALAHAFIDFTLEAEIAAEICRTMRYSTPNKAAVPLLPEEIRRNRAIFPPDEVLSRLELIQDIGETTVLYDRLWTEVKTSE
jgi:spermidine/putrescine transport system permease protein